MTVTTGKPPTSPVGQPTVNLQTGRLNAEWDEVPELTFPQSVHTYGRMRHDPKITAVLRAMFLPIMRTNWAVDPQGVDNAEAVDLVAEDLGLSVLGETVREVPMSPITGFSWQNHTRLALLNLVYGFMPFERWFQIRGGRTHLAGVDERLPATIAEVDIGQDGQVEQVWQTTQDDPIAANRLTWYVNEKEGANWAGTSLLRPCYTPWVLKHEVMRVHATSIRRFGMGIPSVTAPPGATPAQIEEAQRLAAGMRAGDTAGAGLPAGYQFNLTGLTGAAPDAVGFLGYLDQEITGSALASIIELAHATYGSRALGESFLDLFLLSLQAAADAVGNIATYGSPSMPGLARALVEYNWGPGEPIPRIVATDVGDRHEITATSLQLLISCGAIAPDPVLESFIRDAWGLPARPADVPYPAPAAPPAPAPPGGPPPPPDDTSGGPTSDSAALARAGGRRHRSRVTGAATFRRQLTPAEAASGLDPEGLAADLTQAADTLAGRWARVLRDQRADLADQVRAAVDAGDTAGLAGLSAPDAGGTTLLAQAMSDMAWAAARRVVTEAAAQRVTIDPARVAVNEDRLTQIAQARAALAGASLAHAASRRALRVVTATAGDDAAEDVRVTLEGLSPVPLADQLKAAMSAASNEGRVAAFTEADDLAPTYTATEILDASCLSPATLVTTRRGQVRADAVSLDDELATHAGRWVAPSHIIVHETAEPLVTVRTGAGDLTVTADHPVLSCGSGIGVLTWTEAGKLRPGDHLVNVEPDSEVGRELGVPDLTFGQPPHGPAPGGQVRRLTRIDVRSQRMPVGTVSLNRQVGDGEVHDPRPDGDLAAEVVPAGLKRQPHDPLNAGLSRRRPVAAPGAMPPLVSLGVHRPERVAAVRASQFDRRASIAAGQAAHPRAVGVPAVVGDGDLVAAVTAGAGLGHPVTGRAELGTDLRVGEFAGGRAVGRVAMQEPGGDRAAAPLARRRGPAGGFGPEPGRPPGAALTQRPDLDGPPASAGAFHGLILLPVEAVTWEDHAGYLYDFTIPGDETYHAGGVIVHNCCPPCAEVDGTEFASLDEASAAYANGAYIDCEGELRCRGTFIANYPDVTVSGPGEPPGPDFDPAAVGADDSMAKWTDEDGVWDPVRQLLHEQIVDEVLAGFPAEEEPVAYFLGGGPAAGKSSMPTPGGGRAALIAGDDIKGMLPEYQDMVAAGDLRAGAYAHEESTVIAGMARDAASQRSISWLLDGTGDTTYAKIAGKVQAARDGGAVRVEADYVTVDLDEAVRRAASRAAETGRALPAAVITSVHAEVTRVFTQAAGRGLFDAMRLWDNNGTGPVLIATASKTGGLTVLDDAAYARFLAKAA